MGAPVTGLNRDYYQPSQPSHSHAAAGVAGAAGGLALAGGAALAYDVVTEYPIAHPSHPSTVINRDVDITVINERPGYAAGPGWEQPYYQGGEVDVVETRQVDTFGQFEYEDVETVEIERDVNGNVIEYQLEETTIEETAAPEYNSFGQITEYETGRCFLDLGFIFASPCLKFLSMSREHTELFLPILYFQPEYLSYNSSSQH